MASSSKKKTTFAKLNREAAVRMVAGPVRAGQWAANAELKCIDATANSYLVVGAVIAAGLDGIDTGATPPPPSPCCEEPSTASSAPVGISPTPRRARSCSATRTSTAR